MQYSNEVKVGAALILATVLAILGVRFFQDIPLFGDTYIVNAQFEDAAGLTGGNPVRMKGVDIGSVESIRLDQTAQIARARLRIEGDIEIPKGSHVQVSGFSGLGGVRITIVPGPSDNPPLPPGATLSEPAETSALERLTEQGPALVSKADSVLANTNTTMAALRNQFRNPESDLRQTLAATKRITSDLESVTDAEKEELRRLIQNLRAVSSDLKAFMGENADSLDLAVRRLNQSLTRLNRGLASFEHTSATLDTIATKLNRGTGTAGRLLNDPSLYMKLDSTATRTNRLLRDFQQNPSRYLEDLTLVKVF